MTTAKQDRRNYTRPDEPTFDVAKFWARVVKRNNGCWDWLGPRRHTGTGWMDYQGERIAVRRIAWALEHGYVSERTLRTKCNNLDCLNPAHAYQALHADDAPAIIEAWKAGETHQAIASVYGCSRETITRFIGAHR